MPGWRFLQAKLQPGIPKEDKQREARPGALGGGFAGSCQATAVTPDSLQLITDLLVQPSHSCVENQRRLKSVHREKGGGEKKPAFSKLQTTRKLSSRHHV